MISTTSLLMLILQEQWKYYTVIHYLLKSVEEATVLSTL